MFTMDVKQQHDNNTVTSSRQVNIFYLPLQTSHTTRKDTLLRVGVICAFTVGNLCTEYRSGWLYLVLSLGKYNKPENKENRITMISVSHNRYHMGRVWSVNFPSTALSNLRNYSMFISGFHHQIMSGSLMRLE